MSGTDSSERSQRFLAIYKQLDDFLRKKLGNNSVAEDGRPLPFYGLLDTLVAKGDLAVMFYAPALRRLSSLRNAIIHWGPQPYAIAEPHASTIETFENIRKVIMSPPRILEHFEKAVEVALEGDHLRAVMQTMREKAYSQLPIYRSNTLVGILTADAIVRWLAKFPDDQNRAVDDAVASVLVESEDAGNFAVLPDRATVFDALNIFDKRRTISAILVTGSGRPDKRPLTILTIWDYPLLAARVVKA